MSLQTRLRFLALWLDLETGDPLQWLKVCEVSNLKQNDDQILFQTGWANKENYSDSYPTS